MARTDIGRAVPLLKGEYSPTTTYELNDIVSLNGSFYWHYSHEQTTNVAPQATSTWKVVINLADAEAYIARAEVAAESAEDAAEIATAAKTAAESASTTATGASATATTAKNDAVTAKTAAETAQAGAVTAKTAAETARDAAQASATAAGTSATNAGNSAGTAEYYAGIATTAGETASEKATEATGAATTATSAAATATSAKDTAVSSASTASTAATTATSAATAAQAVKDSIPQDYTSLSEDVDDLKTQLTQTNSLKVAYPVYPSSKYGNSGQVLRTDGNGNTEWVDMGMPSEEEFETIVNAWMDEHSGSYVIPDESLTYEKLVPGTLGWVSPLMFGAKGNGIDDDTTAIQNAINAAQSLRKTLNFLDNTYKVTETLNITSPINIIGNKCWINGTIDNAPIFYIKMTSEVRNLLIAGIGVRNYGTGNVVEIDTDYSFLTSDIKLCNFHAESGWCLKLAEMFAHNKIELNTFSGNGIFGEFGDANTIEKNMFFGRGKTGIYLNTPSYGELNNAILNNTIVNSGYAILIDSGDQTLISNNQIEYADSEDSSQTPSAMVYLRGNTRQIKHCIIKNNNFGGGTHLNYDLYIKHGAENVIEGNRFVATNEYDIFVENGGTSGSHNNIFVDDNYSESTQSNPRTDVYQKVKTGATNPYCLIGCWYDVTLSDSTRILKVKKNPGGIVNIVAKDYINQTPLSHTLLATLPLEYRPSQTLYFNVVYNKNLTTPTEAILKIHYNGEISFNDAQEYNSATMVFPSFYA